MLSFTNKYIFSITHLNYCQAMPQVKIGDQQVWLFLKCPHILLLGSLEFVPAALSVELLKNLKGILEPYHRITDRKKRCPSYGRREEASWCGHQAETEAVKCSARLSLWIHRFLFTKYFGSTGHGKGKLPVVKQLYCPVCFYLPTSNYWNKNIYLGVAVVENNVVRIAPLWV